MKIIKDKFGPEYVVKVYDPKIGMEGFLLRQLVIGSQQPENQPIYV